MTGAVLSSWVGMEKYSIVPVVTVNIATHLVRSCGTARMPYTRKSAEAPNSAARSWLPAHSELAWPTAYFGLYPAF